MARLENLLGAQSLALADRLLGAPGDGPGAGASRSASAALVTLHAYPYSTVNWLGSVLGLTSSGITRLVDRLVEARWVTRSTGADARSRQLKLTRTGTKRVQHILAERQATLGAVVSGLSATERATLERLLEKVVTGLADDRIAGLRVCRLCDRAACSDVRRECPLGHTVSSEDR